MNAAFPKDLKSIAILSTSAKGGAGAAARRFSEALRLDKSLQVDFIDMDRLGERLPSDVAPDQSFSNHQISDTHYTVEHPGYVRGWFVSMLQQYDLVNVHWAATLIGLSELDELSRTGQPILFTLHDFHYLTGGCHYPSGCAGVISGCRACPQIDTRRCSLSLPPENLAIKERILSRPNVHIAAPSNYLADRAVASGLTPATRAHCLRNPYQPVTTLEGNRKRNDKTIRIVLIADSFAERRKNMETALGALEHLADMNAPAKFAIDVIGDQVAGFAERIDALRLPVSRHGHLTSHDAIAGIFAGADMIVSCSFEDNWPNILVEGGAYGCAPIVGPGHGCEEFVKTYRFGMVADDYSPQSFADAIVQEAMKGAKTFVQHPAQDAEEQHNRATARIREDHHPELATQRLRDIWDKICETNAVSA